MNEFRRIFKDLDDSVLISLDEFAQLIGVTPGAMAQLRHAGKLPEPAIQGGKLLRWRAGDVRVWLKALNQDSRPAPGELTKRTGRPRSRLMSEAESA